MVSPRIAKNCQELPACYVPATHIKDTHDDDKDCKSHTIWKLLPGRKIVAILGMAWMEDDLVRAAGLVVTLEAAIIVVASIVALLPVRPLDPLP